ncbi:MAG: alpha amylase C-terminal domain-containing protein, partial [Huintestinicola sp.]
DSWEGFKWICADDYTQSVISFRRIDNSDPEHPSEIICVCNFVPVTRTDYKIGVPYEGTYEQIFSTDDLKYGGSGEVDNGKVKAKEYSMHGCDYSVSLTIPGLSAMYFKYIPPKTRKKRTAAKTAEVTETAEVKKAAPKKTSEKKSTAKKPADKPTAASDAPKKRGRKPKNTAKE